MPSAKARAAHIIQYSVLGSTITEQSKWQGQSLNIGAAERLVGLEKLLYTEGSFHDREGMLHSSPPESKGPKKSKRMAQVGKQIRTEACRWEWTQSPVPKSLSSLHDRAFPHSSPWHFSKCSTPIYHPPPLNLQRLRT